MEEKNTNDLDLLWGEEQSEDGGKISWLELLEEVEDSERHKLEKIEKREKEIARRKAYRRKQKRRMVYTIWFLFAMLCMLAILLVTFLLKKAVPAVSEYVGESVEEWKEEHSEEKEEKPLKIWRGPDYVVDYLTPNEYSRPQEPLEEVNNIFVHYTANQGTSAAQNRSYFENIGITGERSASAHFVVGFNGEVIQCLPFHEIGYAVKKHNYDSISIECCYLSDDGEFTEATKESLVHLLAWLISKYDLTTEDILRHYDSNGKMCPKYYVEHEDEWEEIKRDVDAFIQKYGTTEKPPKEKKESNDE